MTPRQRFSIAALAIANAIIILTLAVLVVRSHGAQPQPSMYLRAVAPLHFETQIPTRLYIPPLPYFGVSTSGVSTGRTPQPTALPSHRACQWKGAQLLAQAGLGGTIALDAGGSLRFEITYPAASGQREAAQTVWIAFDIARALQEQPICDVFTQVEVSILAPSSDADLQISASVKAADLAAFDAGQLSEDEFIELVAYTTDVVHTRTGGPH